MPVLTLPEESRYALTVRAKALVFEDPKSRALLDQIGQIAKTEATVLITGETGTGKEIIARHVHGLSQRADKPFVAVNCGAFSESLVESELFGHERGAFTGALVAKAGWFEAAHGGTLFLDEVGDLPLGMQVKLLRVLQEREVVRVGSRQPIPVNVRLLAATNVGLEAAVEAGRFRSDLYYRLNVATIAIPPLRERPGDISPLAKYFIDALGKKLGLPEVELAQGAERQLHDHYWPGNIRELENVIHQALIVCRNGRIAEGDLRLPATAPVSRPPPSPRLNTPRLGLVPPPPESASALMDRALRAWFRENPPNLFEEIERKVITLAYEHCDRNQLQTARLLGVSRNVVRARLIQFGAIAGQLRGPSASEPPSGPIDEFEPGLPASGGRTSGARVLRIGLQTFGPLGVVRALGVLEASLASRGARVVWTELPGGMQILEAIADGEVDLGLVGEGPPVFARAAGLPISLIAAEPPAPDAEGIIVRASSPIRHVADLCNKTILLNKGSNVLYFLVRALEEAGLRTSDVHLSYVPPTGARAAFESGEVDAWAIWDPLLSAAVAQGARVLRTARGLADNLAFYAARSGFAEANPDLVAAVLDSVRQAGELARAEPTSVAATLARGSPLPHDALAPWLATVPFAPTAIGPEHRVALQRIADAFYRERLIARRLTMDPRLPLRRSSSETDWVRPSASDLDPWSRRTAP